MIPSTPTKKEERREKNLLLGQPTPIGPKSGASVAEPALWGVLVSPVGIGDTIQDHVLGIWPQDSNPLIASEN